MYPSQFLKLLIVRRLEADAQPVDAAFFVNMHLVVKQGAGIHLNGDLRILRHIKMILQRPHDVPDQAWFHDRRSASSYEYGRDLIFTAKGTLGFNLPYQLSCICFLKRFQRPEGQEITVQAFPGAKGDVDIQLHWFFLFVGHSLIHLV